MNSKTALYILKRLVLAVLTVWVVITVTFFVMRAVPGGPFASEKALSEAAMKALEAKYGMDKPLMEQYVTYLKSVVTEFDFGPSLTQRGREVIDIITDGMSVSIKLGLVAAFCALATGIVLGAVAALRRNSFIDKIIMVIMTAFVSMPSFIMGSLLLVLFAVINLLSSNFEKNPFDEKNIDDVFVRYEGMVPSYDYTAELVYGEMEPNFDGANKKIDSIVFTSGTKFLFGGL